MTRLYLVDDHPVVREGLRAVLEGAGHTVLGEAGDATLALADVVRLQPDVVLLDLNLGARSGIDVLAELRERGVTAGVIVLTMLDQPRTVAQALRAGAQGYLLKGSPPSELLDAVAKVVAGPPYLAPGLADVAVRGLAAKASSLDELSARERQIVVRVVLGDTSASIAEQLHLSSKTVDTYRSRAMAKLGVADVTGLVRWAIREGLVDVDGA
jgi:two-component system, NarL family, invasion response regulator UvrY